MSKGQTVDRRAPLSQAEAKEKAEKLESEKARIAQILSSGLTFDMLRIEEKDPKKRYCYVRERDVDIAKYRALGYELETDQPAGEHKTGDNRKRVGDVVLMSIDRDRYDLIQEVRREQVMRRRRVPIEEYKKRAAQAAAREEAAPPIDLTEEGE